MRTLAAAISLLTRIPVPIKESPSPREISRSAVFFPAVGLIIGAVMAALYGLVAPVFGPSVAATIAIAAEFFLTGGLHLDGLMDTADGMMSGRRRERALEIMHDARIGPMGAACGVLMLMLRAKLMARAGEAGLLGGLVLAPAAARLGMVLAFAVFPPATPGRGMGSMMARKVGWPAFAAALTYAAAVGIWIAGARSLAAIACSIFAAMIFGQRFSARLGGVTGDAYGALCEIGEAAALAAFAFRAAGGAV